MRCENQDLQLVKEGPCEDSDLLWAVERAQLSVSSSKRQLCHFVDTCYDWERCAVAQCRASNAPRYFQRFDGHALSKTTAARAQGIKRC
eukprot:g16132.t1